MELLNEENYQRTKKTIKIVGLIIMVVGLCLLAGGIYMVISASKMEVPSMGASNWFEASSAKMDRESTGAFMIIPGIFLSIVGAIVRFVVANQREIMAFKAQQMLPVMTEGMEKVVPKVTKVSKDVIEEMTPAYTKMAKTISKEMAPVYGDMAKEISKGIKEGLNEDKLIL